MQKNSLLFTAPFSGLESGIYKCLVIYKKSVERGPTSSNGEYRVIIKNLPVVDSLPRENVIISGSTVVTTCKFKRKLSSVYSMILC